MGWHSKYWDTLDQLYWSPKMLGLTSIHRSSWGDDPDKIVLDRSMVRQGAGLYTRPATASQNTTRLRGLEETLNHLFDITFGIAECGVISRLFVQRFGIDDNGPFMRIGREVQQRYPGFAGNATQQDAFFVSDHSVIGVELKLGSRTTPGQVLKYLALMVAEEKLAGRQKHLALLYITPDAGSAKVFADGAIDPGGKISADFISEVPAKQRNRYIEALMQSDRQHFEDAASRLVIGHHSWSCLVQDIEQIVAEAKTCIPRNETLARLLSGFAEAVAEHTGTNVLPVC